MNWLVLFRTIYRKQYKKNFPSNRDSRFVSHEKRKSNGKIQEKSFFYRLSEEKIYKNEKSDECFDVMQI